MMKRSSCFLIPSLLAMVLTQPALAQNHLSSPLISPDCSARSPRTMASPLDGVLIPDLPGLAPNPSPRIIYLCGACSEGDCDGELEGAPCTDGGITGTCYASTIFCGAGPRRYCGCF